MRVLADFADRLATFFWAGFALSGRFFPESLHSRSSQRGTLRLRLVGVVFVALCYLALAGGEEGATSHLLHKLKRKEYPIHTKSLNFLSWPRRSRLAPRTASPGSASKGLSALIALALAAPLTATLAASFIFVIDETTGGTAYVITGFDEVSGVLSLQNSKGPHSPTTPSSGTQNWPNTNPPTPAALSPRTTTRPG